ncbi:hypothetical protein GCM10009665_35110 [Kitasatospora nipponensis]|uniref:Uncharacterized protein n=1 Tax=Kitasatospora nipponensis TaxID=258049 RepID=A0ABP4GWI7_9ACTN
MKRRSVQNDPIGTPERDRGAVIIDRFTLDITTATPVKPALKGQRKDAPTSK